MALTNEQKLVTGAAVGIGAIALLLYLSSNASAAQGGANPTGPTLDPTSTRGAAAIALAAAIQAANGYSASESALVIAYEQAAGLSVDAGYPGTQVMTTLRSDLAAIAAFCAITANNCTNGPNDYPLVGSIAVYPWTAAGGWTTGNVPAAFVGSSASDGSKWAGTTVGT